jgi:hypothetical protein
MRGLIHTLLDAALFIGALAQQQILEVPTPNAVDSDTLNPAGNFIFNSLTGLLKQCVHERPSYSTRIIEYLTGCPMVCTPMGTRSSPPSSVLTRVCTTPSRQSERNHARPSGWLSIRRCPLESVSTLSFSVHMRQAFSCPGDPSGRRSDQRHALDLCLKSRPSSAILRRGQRAAQRHRRSRFSRSIARTTRRSMGRPRPIGRLRSFTCAVRLG